MQIRFASPADNHQLLELSRQTPMEGGLCVNVERHPDYFQLANLQGTDARVLVAEEDGVIVGAIGCARRAVVLAGKTCKIAYLGGIKLAAERRNGLTAYRLVKGIYDYLLTTDVEYGVLLVMGGNRAMEALLAGRVGIPQFYQIATFHLYYCLPRWIPPSKSAWRIRPANAHDEDRLFELWQQFYQRFELRPVDLAVAWRQMKHEPAFGLENFLVAEKDGRLVAAISTWDQQSFKQTVVADYGRTLALITWPLRLTGLPPRIGLPLRELQIRHLIYEPGAVPAARQLVQATLRQARRRYQFVRCGVGNYYPEDLLKGILRLKIPLACYLAPREVTPEKLKIIRQLPDKFIYEDLCLH